MAQRQRCLTVSKILLKSMRGREVNSLSCSADSGAWKVFMAAAGAATACTRSRAARCCAGPLLRVIRPLLLLARWVRALQGAAASAMEAARPQEGAVQCLDWRNSACLVRDWLQRPLSQLAAWGRPDRPSECGVAACILPWGVGPWGRADMAGARERERDRLGGASLPRSTFTSLGATATKASPAGNSDYPAAAEAPAARSAVHG